MDTQRLETSIMQERTRILRQIVSLEGSVAAIVDAAELVSTDDEHDPEGATIAYERAQALALLRQARVDLAALDVTLERLVADGEVRCEICTEPIGLERLEALPMTSRCVGCAS